MKVSATLIILAAGSSLVSPAFGESGHGLPSDVEAARNFHYCVMAVNDPEFDRVLEALAQVIENNE